MSGMLVGEARTASLSWLRLGIDRPSVAMLEPSTTTRLAPSTFVIVMCVLRRFGLRDGPRRTAAEAGRRCVVRRPPASSRSAPAIVESATVIRAVLWDFGGVILTSPFDAFARYEAERGLPAGFIRRVNSDNVHTNAWARLERNELSAGGFDEAFAGESAALGHRVPGRDVLTLLVGDVRPQMVHALDIVRAAGLRNGLPHQQRGRGRLDHGAPGRGRRDGALRRGRRVVAGRGAQARAGVLRAGLRDARRSTRRRACSSTTSAST